MSEAYKMDPGQSARGELDVFRGSGLSLIIMGIALIVLGFLAIGASFIATLATMTVFGILFLIGAGVEVFTVIWGRQWRGFFLHLLTGILYLVAGLFLLERPIEAAVGLTLLIAAFLLVGGLLRIVISVVDRFHGWGWMLLSGIISVFLGVAIWREWPFSGLWVIGLFVGIEMLFLGWTWVFLGMAVRSLPKVSKDH